jgi:hypothetical protein
MRLCVFWYREGKHQRAERGNMRAMSCSASHSEALPTPALVPCLRFMAGRRAGPALVCNSNAQRHYCRSDKHLACVLRA